MALLLYDERPLPNNCTHILDSSIDSRRSILQKGAALATGAILPGVAGAYTLPDLPYPYESLEPHIDAATMKLHHDKHHATYVAGINKYMEGKDEPDIVDLMTDALEAGPTRNSGGGHYNHAFFWSEMAPAAEAKKTKVSDQLQGMIDKSFGSMDAMKEQFAALAAPAATFGSGWVWVCVTDKDELKLVNTPNQDNPLMKGSAAGEIMYPILGLDVWGKFQKLYLVFLLSYCS